MSTDAEVVTRQLLDAWNARDVPRYVGLMTEDVEWYDPAMPQPPARGRAAVQAFSESVLRAFPDFTYEVLGPLCVSADGTHCAVHWRVTATHLAPLTPPGPAGRLALEAVAPSSLAPRAAEPQIQASRIR